MNPKECYNSLFAQKLIEELEKRNYRRINLGLTSIAIYE